MIGSNLGVTTELIYAIIIIVNIKIYIENNILIFWFVFPLDQRPLDAQRKLYEKSLFMKYFNSIKTKK